ncbi:MAG: hypothetical protein LBU95_01410 [Rikenellaceae bacterium]|jgi:hypothetical protein|nr:hypothetical protein [Rikenellaceae bacterium]
MKHLITVAVLLLVAQAAGAQRLMVGEKAPDLKVKEWPYGKPEAENTPRFIEFFHSGSAPSVERVARLHELASARGTEICVILVCHEDAATVRAALGAGPLPYYVAIDEGGRSFTAYGVQYVPFAAITDRKGRLTWFGNPGKLTAGEIAKHME